MIRLLGLSWDAWVRFAVVSWLLLFAAAWISLPVAWLGHSEEATILLTMRIDCYSEIHSMAP